MKGAKIIKFTYSEILDLISLCKCDIKNTKLIIQNINPKDTDFIDAMQEDIEKETELIKKLESLKSTLL